MNPDKDRLLAVCSDERPRKQKHRVGRARQGTGKAVCVLGVLSTDGGVVLLELVRSIQNAF